jgi:hypothetical protein
MDISPKQEAPNIHQPTDSSPNLSIAIRTLTTGGFMLESADRNPGYVLLHMSRVDEFGANQSYSFAIAEERFGHGQVATAQIAADHRHAQLILIGPNESGLPTVEWDQFINLFGGPVFSASPLEPDFAEHLITLGSNQVPEGLQGRADDLFDAYARIALEFMLGTRVVRYGQNRLFEARPDGIVLPYRNFAALYDAKAYRNGYEMTAESIRQFKSYVDDFSGRYQSYLRLNAFVVISGTFKHGTNTLARRSRELLAECGVPLTFLTASSLADIIALLVQHPKARRSIHWPKIFVEPVIDPQHVRTELEAVLRDDVIPGP